LNITTQGVGGVGGDGRGWIWFGYPKQFPLLKEIRDSSNLLVISSFLTYSVTINSPNNRWQSRDYIFYINSTATSGTTYPYNPINWNFIFATQS
jgi:hypothetical protein